MPKTVKFTYEYVKDFFKEQGCKLIDQKYINSKTKMKYICQCGRDSEIIFESFKRGSRCQKCAGNKRFTYEYVKEYFKQQKCELLEKEYINSLTKMAYICSCGDKSKISFNNFKDGHRCRKCSGCEKYSFKHIEQYFKDQDCELLEKEYENNNTKMKYLCSCGNMSQISFNNFRQGHRCKKCAIIKHSGKNNSSYNHNLTDKDRIDRRLIPKYREWVRNIYKKNSYICQKCKDINNKNGKRKIKNAHHIEGYAENPNIRLDINNGITLCEKCHQKFHSIYGKTNITRSQLNEFLSLTPVIIKHKLPSGWKSIKEDEEIS